VHFLWNSFAHGMHVVVSHVHGVCKSVLLPLNQ
jgi:hypothetical protein